MAYVKSRRARRLTLSVKPWRGVRVTLPWHSAYREAEAFLLRHTMWIKDKLDKAKHYEQAFKSPLSAQERRKAEDLLRQRALEYLPGRTAELAAEHGFSYRRVSIRRSRTRWGSCSAVNNINLSIFLMQLPRHLADYVILHELVHTVHRNHSPAFWNLLDEHTGNARALAREIKKFRITL
ncbi:MAG: SprT family zinc-dependent metalloprotease [Bacteroidales bacterium]